MKHFAFQDLEIYQLSKSLVKDNYSITKGFPTDEKYSLVQQMNRASISIPSNIAEGYSRSSIKEKCHFFNMAYGSLMELVCQYEIANDQLYINVEELETFINKAYTLSIKISNFKTAVENSGEER